MDMLLVAHADAYSRPGVADETIVLLWIIGNVITPQGRSDNISLKPWYCGFSLDDSVS